MAHVTPGFSFAYMQECFVATLLALAREDDEADSRDDLDGYRLWVAFKEQADILRRDLDDQKTRHSQLLNWCKGGDASVETAPENVKSSEAQNRRHRCCQHSQCPRQSTPMTDSLQRLHLTSEFLPELPWFEQKSEYINSVSSSIARM